MGGCLPRRPGRLRPAAVASCSEDVATPIEMLPLIIDADIEKGEEASKLEGGVARKEAAANMCVDETAARQGAELPTLSKEAARWRWTCRRKRQEAEKEAVRLADVKKQQRHSTWMPHGSRRQRKNSQKMRHANRQKLRVMTQKVAQEAVRQKATEAQEFVVGEANEMEEHAVKQLRREVAREVAAAEKLAEDAACKEVEAKKVAEEEAARQAPARYSRATRHGALLRGMTVDLLDTYSHCSESFDKGLIMEKMPRGRCLTQPGKSAHNKGYDNEEYHYICHVNDKITNPDNITYEIFQGLGKGTFGQVLKAQPSNSANPVALKIVKNKSAFFDQALTEVRILQILNEQHVLDDNHGIVRMLDYFVYRKHVVMVFESLGPNLYEVLEQNSFRGVSLQLNRVITVQLLRALQCLQQARVIHCDLKPENVLLSGLQHSPGDTKIKLIDFGSSCFENHAAYSYIQSRFYRSPEVVLGLPYTSAIDMWSLGCICAELFLGLPIFPGHSEYDLLRRMIEILAPPPNWMLKAGTKADKFFVRVEGQPEASEEDAGATKRPVLVEPAEAQGGKTTHRRVKTLEEYEQDAQKKEKGPKNFFDYKSLTEVCELVPYKTKVAPANATTEELEKVGQARHLERERRLCFQQLLAGLLNCDPRKRLTPEHALDHAFAQDTPYDPLYQPPEENNACQEARAPMKRSARNHETPPPSECYRPPIKKLSGEFDAERISRAIEEGA